MKILIRGVRCKMFLFSQRNVITNEEKILKILNSELKNSKIIGNSIYLYKHDLTIEPRIESLDNNGFAQIVEVSFIMKQEFFNESYIERTIGIGETVEKAFQKCVDNFFTGPFYSIKNCMNDKFDEHFETEFLGSRRTWELFESAVQGLYNESENQNIHIWDAIREKIKVRLGKKNIYFVKVYIARHSNGEISAECYINGNYNTNVSKDVLEDAKKWNINIDIYSIKQYFVIKQENCIANECEFTEEEVKEFTIKAIKVLGNCNSEEKLKMLNSDIFNITGNKNITFEIKNFITETLCELVFRNINYSDEINIIVENKTEKLKYYKNQFTNYYWIYNQVKNSYYNNTISEEEIKTILLLSWNYKVITNVLNNGIDINSLENISMILHAYEGYIPL